MPYALLKTGDRAALQFVLNTNESSADGMRLLRPTDFLGDKPVSAWPDGFSPVDDAVGKAAMKRSVVPASFGSLGGPRFNDSHVPAGSPDGGQFASKDGGGSADATIFASPSEAENHTFADAVKMLGSQQQVDAQKLANDVVTKVDSGGDAKSVVGDWSDGAENSLLVTAHTSDMQQVQYMAALLGDKHNQKSVIPFVPNPKGPDALWQVTIPGNLAAARKGLDQYGVQFRTLEPVAKNSTKVYVFDQGGGLKETMQKLGAHYGQPVTVTHGQGSFLGGDTRAEGHAAYKVVIQSYEKAHPAYKH